jgi:hypothetical protein
MIRIDLDQPVPLELRDSLREFLAASEIAFSLLTYPSDEVDSTYINDSSSEAQMRVRREFVPLTRGRMTWGDMLSCMAMTNKRLGVVLTRTLELDIHDDSEDSET